MLPLLVFVVTVRRGYVSSMGSIVFRSIGYSLPFYVVMIMWVLFSSGINIPLLSMVGFWLMVGMYVYSSPSFVTASI